MTTIETRHPDYLDRTEEWELMRFCDRGQTAIHGEGQRYLPMPSGFTSQPDKGVAMFAAYLKRARFAEMVAPTVRGMTGLIHRSEAQITLPKVLLPLWENATIDGLPLEAFHRRVTRQILLMGRYSILTDVAEDADLPHLAGYAAESLINWTRERDFFVLDETGPKRNGFLWKDEVKFRELVLEDGSYVQFVYDGKGTRESAEMVVPTMSSGESFEEIPFVVITPQDLSTNVVEPPLIGMARATIAAYQLDADYRHQLYTSGQETLFCIGATELPKVVGSGVVHGLPQGASAMYVGPSGTGIEAHRLAIAEAKDEGMSAGARLFDRQSGQESGEALRIRYSAQTASLTNVALTSAQALEASLRFAAEFVGADPDEVVVKPNLRFVETAMTPEQAVKLMELWTGRAISKRSLFENLQRGEIVSAERGYEDEEELIDADGIDAPTGGGGGSGDQ